MCSKGILTLGFGSQKYRQMAKGLGRSIRRHDTDIPLAVVSDAPPSTFTSFDRVIPARSEYGSGVSQKLHLDLYSPFEETLFIDSDCLVYRHPSELWSFYREADGFGVAAWKFLERGDEYGFLQDTGDTLRRLGIERMPHFNGGMYYFDDSASGAVFERARHLYKNREQLGFTSFRNAPVNDEPVIGLAMELEGVDPLDFDGGRIIHTAIGETEGLDRVNVLREKSRYKKGGRWTEPVVIHFNVEMQESYVYQRELYRLAMEGTVGVELKSQVAAAAKAAHFETSQKWKKMKRRVREMGATGVIPGRFLRQMGGLRETVSSE